MDDMTDSGVDLSPLIDRSIMDPRAREFLNYWTAHCADGEPPHRADIDPPIDIPRLVPEIYLVNVVDRGRDYVVRLIGTRLAARYGSDATGRSLGELTAGAYRSMIFGLLRAVLDTRRPVYSITNYLQPDRNHLIVERLMVPLLGDENDVSIIMVMQVFHADHVNWDEPFQQVLERVSEGRQEFRFRAYTV